MGSLLRDHLRMSTSVSPPAIRSSALLLFLSREILFGCTAALRYIPPTPFLGSIQDPDLEMQICLMKSFTILQAIEKTKSCMHSLFNLSISKIWISITKLKLCLCHMRPLENRRRPSRIWYFLSMISVINKNSKSKTYPKKLQTMLTL